MPHFVVSDLGLHCLSVSHKKDVWLTVLSAKSDSDIMFCLQLLSKTPIELTRINRSCVY